jgi:hypothetical protein
MERDGGQLRGIHFGDGESTKRGEVITTKSWSPHNALVVNPLPVLAYYVP